MTDSSGQKCRHTSPHEFQTNLSQLEADTALRFKVQNKSINFISKGKTRKENECWLLLLGFKLHLSQEF